MATAVLFLTAVSFVVLGTLWLVVAKLVERTADYQATGRSRPAAWPSRDLPNARRGMAPDVEDADQPWFC